MQANHKRTTQDLVTARADSPEVPPPGLEPYNRELFTGLGELARYIDVTMRKLNELERPLAATAGHLPQASDVLTDLTRMTEEGTHRVMELTENLLENQGRVCAALETLRTGLSNEGPGFGGFMAQCAALTELVAANQTALMDIITALSFQDLVGQRIKKVVGILDEVQSRLLELVVVFGRKGTPRDPSGERTEVLLKELEASKRTAMKQEVVDDLLKEFGF